MASTTFTWTPSFPASQESTPSVRRVTFGDGYEQRLSYGLNTDLKQWDLVFENRTDSERDQILNFLNARKGVEAFNWTPPHGGTRAFVCDAWNAELNACNLNTVRAKFRQVVDI